MGDTENSLQSKKRGALREISRDNPGLDDEEEDPIQESGTFKKASEEVLATRRMVSVRRKPKPASAPAPNPFAGIKLVAPSAASVPTNPEPPTEKESADVKVVSNDVDSKTEKGKEEEEKDKETEENKKTENDVVVTEEEAESKAEEKIEAVAENEEKKEDVSESGEKKGENTPLSSFQQLSSGQNAFTNLSGTGFSASTFSFGPIKTDGSGFGSGSGSASLFGLALPNNNNNGSSSLFGSGSASSAAKSSEAAVAPMKEVEVETGEENEEAVFSADSILYEFSSTGWKERGKGEVKINVLKAEKDKARLVMRARGNYRLILNANVFPDMKFEAMDKKGLSFACLNSTGETSGGFSTFALKFRDRSVVEDFRSAVAAHRGKNAKPAILKTPENSPKASDE